jgi:crotonobetainyl-CoA:carnitine CoA-transferase CaiB-like acyl-CoA transferase
MAVAPLAGINVLEVANWLAGPSCAALLSDLGASVIKVEPPQGDAYRHLLMMAAGYENNDICPGFEMDNRGKRSIALDLDTAPARQVLMKLAARADIVITNLVPERRDKYGFSPDDVRRLNPTVIYASVTGFGSVGPDANKAGWDHTGFWARSGIMGVMAAEGEAPFSCRGGMGDHPTGLNLLAAILVALRMRDQTGEGQFVDVALQQTGMWALGLDLESCIASGQLPQLRRSRVYAGNPTANTYLCKDGRWIFLLMPTADYWERFCRILGKEEWLADPRLQTLQDRAGHSTELIPACDEVFATKDFGEWARILDDNRMIYSNIPVLTEVLADPQPRAMDAFVAVDHPRLGRFELLNTPFHVWGADIGVRGRAPGIGEHTEEVLADLGLSAEEIADCAAGGAFG